MQKDIIKLKRAPSILASYSVVGKKELEGPLKDTFNEFSISNKFGMDTWEKAEGEMQRRAVSGAITKSGLKESDIELLLPVGIDVSKDIKKVYNLYSESLDAPISKDTVVGDISLVYNGEILASSKLLTTASVERSSTLYYLDVIDKIISTTWFKVSLASFIILSIAYLCLSVFLRNRRFRKNKKLL